MTDKATTVLIDVLKHALAESGEQRLFKSGKLEGLFPSRSGTNAEASAKAITDGLLEVVRTEIKGKTAIEWVRITPKGMEYLHTLESPVQALRDLQTILQVNREQVPIWLADMQGKLQEMARQLTDQAQRWSHRLEALSGQVEAALERATIKSCTLPDSVVEDAPWAEEALAYLDHRKSAGAKTECDLPELFAALRERHADLSVPAFHDRLRRLQDRQLLKLIPFDHSPSEIPEPEYALLEGTTLYYHVSR